MAQPKLNAKALGFSLALISGILMLLLGILGAMGYAAEAVRIMQAHHIFFDLSALGIILGIIEAGIFSYVAGWLIAYFYNRAFLNKLKL